jgi:hypothetical protein
VVVLRSYQDVLADEHGFGTKALRTSDVAHNCLIGIPKCLDCDAGLAALGKVALGNRLTDSRVLAQKNKQQRRFGEQKRIIEIEELAGP